MKVALFDIDGTILHAHGAGSRAMEAALVAKTGKGQAQGQFFAGKTDPQIVREAMRHHGFADRDIDARMAGVLEHYLGGLDAELATTHHDRINVLPGVVSLLDACEAHDSVLLGLLTGNLAVGAERKLRAVGLDPARFQVGAFGSDHEDRPALAAIARERAAGLLRRELTAAQCVVLGDTPADVACGQAIGARTIAVATGHYSAAELRNTGADIVFDDFRDTRAVMAAILAD
jgi:phosphoglycolate phosphatase-like HAD superfamily hydrolase